MRSRYQVSDGAQAHFITATIVAWLPIFTKASRCDIIVESFAYCRAHKGLKVYAWVILDNHVHAIVSAPDLSQALADFKRHTARRLLETLQAESCESLLNQLHYYRAKHKAESAYQVWQEGSHPQACLSDAILEQKLEYLHNNPVKRGLVASPEHWRYSSAHEWLPGAVVDFKCDPWR
jgi:REP element-mobilizing transposase RayT